MHSAANPVSDDKSFGTHSAVLVNGDLVDVLAVPNTPNTKVWIDQTGQEYREWQIDSLIPIPGQADRSTQPTQNDQNSSVRKPSYRVLPDGRIVSLSGKPWTFRGNALRVLHKLSMSETHTVDGFGNSGPRGREWWIRKKQTGFLKIPYLLNNNEMPVDIFSQYTIDLMIDTLEKNQKETLLFDIKRLKNEWNFKYHKRPGIIGFQNKTDYLAFVKHVLRDIACSQ